MIALTVVLSYSGDVTEVFTLQEKVNLSKPRSIIFLPLPTLPHEIIDLSRTRLRPRHHSLLTIPLVPVTTVLHYLLVGQFRERSLPTHHQNLPQRHCEGPNVALRCVLALKTTCHYLADRDNSTINNLQ